MNPTQNPMLFSERVNAASALISSMTVDPSEKLGIAGALYEIYKHELQKYFVTVKPPGGEDAQARPAETAGAEEAK